MNAMFLPTLLSKDTFISPITTGGMVIALISAAIGYYKNKQNTVFWGQVIGIIMWAAMLVRGMLVTLQIT